MAVSSVTEYTHIKRRDIPIADWNDGVVEQTLLTFTTTTASAAFATGTRFIRICPSADCYYTIAAAPTATTAGARLSAGSVEYIGVSAGEKIALVAE